MGWTGARFFRGHKRISYRNSFQTHVAVRFSAESTGTRLLCRFGMHPVVIAFMTVWFAGLLAIGVLLPLVLSGVAIGFPVHEPRSPLAMLVPPAMLGFGYALVRFCRWLARDEAAFLLAFLERTLDATPVSQRPSESGLG